MEANVFDLLGKLGGSPVDGLNPDGLAGLVASVGQLILRGIEGEGLQSVSFHNAMSHHFITCLHHIRSRPEELPVKLPNCLRVLHSGLRGPWTCLWRFYFTQLSKNNLFSKSAWDLYLDISPFLKCKHKSSIANHRTLGESLQQSLHKHDQGSLAAMWPGVKYIFQKKTYQPWQTVLTGFR